MIRKKQKDEIKAKFKTQDEINKMSTQYLMGYTKRLKNYIGWFNSKYWIFLDDLDALTKYEYMYLKSLYASTVKQLENRPDYEEVLDKKYEREYLKERKRKYGGCQKKSKGKRKAERIKAKYQ